MAPVQSNHRRPHDHRHHNASDPDLTMAEVAVHFEAGGRRSEEGNGSPGSSGRRRSRWCKDNGLSQVTRRLRLSGRDLNKRCGILGSGRRRARRAEPPVAFVELAPEVVVQTQRRRSTPGCLELIRPDGLRLRIEPGDGIEPRAVLERFMEVG